MENLGTEAPCLMQIKCQRFSGPQGHPPLSLSTPSSCAWWMESLSKGDSPLSLAGTALRADPAVSTEGGFQPTLQQLQEPPAPMGRSH